MKYEHHPDWPRLFERCKAMAIEFQDSRTLDLGDDRRLAHVPLQTAWRFSRPLEVFSYARLPGLREQSP